MKNVVVDVEKTLGDLYYIGEDPVYEYVNNRRTDKVIGYNYKLASSVQGEQVTVKVLGDKKEFEMMQKVKLVGPEVNIYATANKNGFAEVRYSIKAVDIVNG